MAQCNTAAAVRTTSRAGLWERESHGAAQRSSGRQVRVMGAPVSGNNQLNAHQRSSRHAQQAAQKVVQAAERCAARTNSRSEERERRGGGAAEQVALRISGNEPNNVQPRANR